MPAKMGDFLRDHAATLIIIATFMVGTYTNVTVLNSQIEGLKQDFQIYKSHNEKDQDQQWAHIMRQGEDIHDSQTKCAVITEKVAKLEEKDKG